MTDIGRITSVLPEKEQQRVYVSVRVSPDEYYEKIPFASGKTGLWMVPKEGEIVEVYEVGFETFIARYPHSPEPDIQMPDLSEGDFCLRLNGGTELSFRKQSDGTINLDLSTDGDVTISAAKTVTIGGETEAVSVAVQDHDHNVTLSDGSTATTGKPNQSGTSTTVE